MKFDLIVSDIDGVLLAEGIDPAVNFQMLKNLKDQQGIKTTVATGRPDSLTRSAIDLDAFSGPLICENGAYISDIHGNPLLTTLVPLKVLHFIELIHKKPSISTIDFVPHEAPNTFFMYKADEVTSQQLIDDFSMENVRATTDFELFRHWMQTHSFSKIIIIMKDHHGKIIIPPYINHSSSLHRGTRYYDITDDFVSKRLGVLFVAGYYNIPLHRVMVIGNDNNDIPMFQINTVTKVAVNDRGQAPEELIRRADHIIEPQEVARIHHLL